MEGVLFGDKHSYRDWGLYLKARPEISPPKPKTVYVQIPEADGQLDLSDVLMGDIAFENRNITCNFLVVGGREKWADMYSEILDYLHGRKMQVVFDDDPSYYYEGRFQVDKWSSSSLSSTIVISGNVEPYKIEDRSSLDGWLWDDFCFDTDIVRDWGNLEVDESLVLTVVGSRKPVVPIFVVETEEESMALTWGDDTYLLQNGENRIPNITIREGSHIMVFEGNGTVSIRYRGGRL